jgi:hypothetical protein
MASTEASIHIKLGHLKIEYKGDPSFLDGPLLGLCTELLALQNQNPTIVLPGPTVLNNTAGTQTGTYEQSTDTIATLLGSSSGPNLAIAAAAHLHFVKGKRRFSRKEIGEEMKSAPGHYKASFFANLTGTLKRLTLDDRLLFGDKHYSLSNSEIKSLEVKFAQA